MKFVLFFLFFCLNLAAADFISREEYAKMLYQNPRGIGCGKCHGNKGQGMIIAEYKSLDKKNNKKINQILSAPKITNLTYPQFKSALKESKGMMPTYFLTDGEIKSLYDYVKTLEKRKVK